MKAARQLTIAMLLLAVIAALYSGYSLISDPTGSTLGIPFYWLNGTMFKDFTTPGWIILLAIGVLGIITIATVIKRIRHFHLLVIVQGAIICILVIAQMIIIGEENMLQYLFLMMGMAIAIVGGLLSQADKKIRNKE
ncbi:hypothetical protein [Sediminibacterium sp.]|jgi:hypothetical protein|uniref:hypothetical protein n=1 Tax=Sediminibacterium sp. TaxID=1917865 RepID=UPI0025F78620|nr:hypothetical protein [Sediminibacterium sp.]MBW0177888.1 hypothetical protein [Sediminibacterium sp.]